MSLIIRPFRMPRLGIALAVAPVLLLIACTHDQPKALVPTVATAAPIPAPVAATPPPDTSFKVSEAVRVKCHLRDTPTDSPQFDFDQADLRPRGMGILDDIATCVQKGSMMGEGLIVTGHAHPRGSDSYDEDRGMRRANTARDYLVSKGFASADITVTSRVKLDAARDEAAG